ncbi:hypothetical protein [Priestia megaterium]|uniref:hypothetical protein n=1 Tax=Priestia megaterium TaxID=1404 RepID=UPI00236458BE|nr:hypothetical protein [Priestia megaterium]MDD1515782.1 hypothetical protein [Priestia megaterium]
MREIVEDYFDYNGVRAADVETIRYKGKKIKEIARFTYKETLVRVEFDSDYTDQTLQKIAQKECMLIDNLGSLEYRNYCIKRDRLKEIENDFIVLDNKVYNYHEDKYGEIPYIQYSLSLTLENGQHIFSDIPVNFFTAKIKKDKKASLERLRGNAKKYFGEGVKPDLKHLDETLTLEYMQNKIWVNKKLKGE